MPYLPSTAPALSSVHQDDANFATRRHHLHPPDGAAVGIDEIDGQDTSAGLLLDLCCRLVARELAPCRQHRPGEQGDEEKLVKDAHVSRQR
jgi:hypothetical protein